MANVISRLVRNWPRAGIVCGTLLVPVAAPSAWTPPTWFEARVLGLCACTAVASYLSGNDAIRAAGASGSS
ncbi:hypothetical protein AURDEDRAFT_116143 [Auricularia subglabra TFB-10046 SS5]|nr:hypothetical protein AURDEDRAFT_116143 [Auricularia subglabra TFB-10046 SS5]